MVSAEPRPLTDEELVRAINLVRTAIKARMGTLPAAPEPSTYSGMPRPGPFTLENGTQYLPPPPLTDEELDAILRKRREALGWSNDAGTIEPGQPESQGSSDDAVYDLAYEPYIPRLVAEVRRLRSDEWLERAIEEIAHGRADGWSTGVGIPTKADLLAILRKHRDWKA